MRVGLHGRNDVQWPDEDIAVLNQAKIETIKMMSHTSPDVFRRISEQVPGAQFTTRLYDDRIGTGGFPKATDFVAKMLPIIASLRPYCTRFEIHNEPNHEAGIEGWGSTDAHAKSFSAWYELVLSQLRYYAPWAQYGFPGLCAIHRDMQWLNICRDVIQASDFLGVHPYWQYNNMLSPDWGLRFVAYHAKFPTKELEITEFGDATPNLPDEVQAANYVTYYQTLMRYPYIRAASAFLLSSPDATWESFAWRRQSGQVRPVVPQVGAMQRQVPILRIVDIHKSLKKHPTKKYDLRQLSQIKTIVIHHTATPPETSPYSVARYHVDTNGWPGIGYHYYIVPDGTVYLTQPMTVVSYHSGNANPTSIGVCFAGSFMQGRKPTEQQLAAAHALTCHIYERLGRAISVMAHKELMQTRCPGDTWAEWQDRLLAGC